MKYLSRLFAIVFITLYASIGFSAGFTPVNDHHWNKNAVRKVLHTFAFGGFASDQQIHDWAHMPAKSAIAEMLTFDPVNSKLSPAEDASANYADSLKSLQEYWGDPLSSSPVNQDKWRQYSFLTTRPDGTTTNLSTQNLKNTWMQATNTHGINPFLHRVGLYLTNYNMSIRASKTRAALFRKFYDQTILDLARSARGEINFFDLLADGASTAAVSRAYRHMYNRYVNNRFYGNDDFAREFHQLFFKIQGVTETGTTDKPGQAYHENVTIEHTAWLLTGMNLTRQINAFGSTDSVDWLLFPIDFYSANNVRNHHTDCLEIYNSALQTPNICGATAKDKLFNLAQVAGYHQESLNNMPVIIIDHFADDNLDDEKRSIIRQAWIEQEPKDLLAFIRSYAISKTFHKKGTFKYHNAFDRNLITQNKNTLTNEESFSRKRSLFSQMRIEGAEIFQPAHDVFGGQTGLQAANNPNIFKAAYSRNVLNPNVLGEVERTYTDAAGNIKTWSKNWGSVAPYKDGAFHVKKVAGWLWQRFIADGERNFDIQAKAQVYSMLARGVDFGYLASIAYPGIYTADQTFTSNEIDNNPDLHTLYHNIKNDIIDLENVDPAIRKKANANIGLAVNFITATPYMFALEGK